MELALENKKDKDTSIVVIDEDERVSQKEINTRNAAIKKARKNDILFVYSIPCFEFWALLHFEYTSASLSRKECQKRLQKYLPEYNHKKKALVLDFSKLVNKQEQAITFAKRLISQHQNKLEGIDLENPTTNAFIIIEKIKEFIKSFPK